MATLHKLFCFAMLVALADYFGLHVARGRSLHDPLWSFAFIYSYLHGTPRCMRYCGRKESHGFRKKRDLCRLAAPTGPRRGARDICVYLFHRGNKAKQKRNKTTKRDKAVSFRCTTIRYNSFVAVWSVAPRAVSDLKVHGCLLLPCWPGGWTVAGASLPCEPCACIATKTATQLSKLMQCLAPMRLVSVHCRCWRLFSVHCHCRCWHLFSVHCSWGCCCPFFLLTWFFRRCDSQLSILAYSTVTLQSMHLHINL